MGKITKQLAWQLTLITLLFCPSSILAAPPIDMVKVPGGCFQMGDTFGDGDNDEKPAHKVCLKEFSIGKYEVTQELWQAVMGNNPAEFKGAKLPVESVPLTEVVEFIKKLRQETGVAYRLPTEAEWEYAARSGGKAEKWAGTSDGKQLNEFAHFGMKDPKSTLAVGSKKPNGLGIYDMTGNVGEWCSDRYNEAFYSTSSQDSPTGASEGTNRVTRGGSWVDDEWSTRTVRRGSRPPNHKSDYEGFRLAVTPK
jgi:formylglycine-generating enzyme required for sulfatase activity